MDFLKIGIKNEGDFERIANELLINHAIKNHASIFRIVDIEFYWNSPNHKDESTYKRKYVNPNHGEWFFHYSGVDIALKNEEIGGYGGILIRGIYDIHNGTLYNGPMVCAMKLFSGTSAFSESIKTKIVPYKCPTSKINKGPRKGLGKNAIVSGTDKLNYRYYINPDDIR